MKTVSRRADRIANDKQWPHWLRLNRANGERKSARHRFTVMKRRRYLAVSAVCWWLRWVLCEADLATLTRWRTAPTDDGIIFDPNRPPCCAESFGKECAYHAAQRLDQQCQSQRAELLRLRDLRDAVLNWDTVRRSDSRDWGSHDVAWEMLDAAVATCRESFPPSADAAGNDSP